MFVRWGGVLYICVPHEHYYEKDIWPSKNNSDHKWSFTKDKKTNLPKNVDIKSFLLKYSNFIDIIDIRENLSNYDFDCDQSIDQTVRFEDGVCAQIDFIVRKRSKTELAFRRRVKNEMNWLIDTIFIIIPIRIKLMVKKKLPKRIKKIIRYKCF